MVAEPKTKWRGLLLGVALVAGALFALAAWLLLTYVEPRYLAWIGLIGLFDLAGALGGLVLAGQIKARMRDPVTGLYNRTFVEGELGREIERARRYRRSLTVLTMHAEENRGGDLNEINLRSLAGVLLACTRASDTPCRSGPAEFTLLLPETDPLGASVLGRRIHELIDRRAQAGTLPVTAHLGVAGFPAHADGEAILAAASRAARQARSKRTALEVALASIPGGRAGTSS